MDSIQLFQTLVWSFLATLCMISIVWGISRERGWRPPLPFFIVQIAFVALCLMMAAQSATLAVLPMRMPGYVDALMQSGGAGEPQPAALTPEALSNFQDARGRVRGSVKNISTRVMPSSRTLFVEVTFTNRDVLLLSIAYRDSQPEWLPVSFGPYKLLIESAMFLPYQRSPLHMIATAPCQESSA